MSDQNTYLSLGKGDVERLGEGHVAVHLGNSLGGLLGLLEADESESLRTSVLVAHDLAGSDGSVLLEDLSELGLLDGVVKVLDVEVHSLVSLHALGLLHLVLSLELGLSLALLLGAAHEQLLLGFAELLLVHLVDGLLSHLGLLEGDESESLGLSIHVVHDGAGSDLKGINN